MCYHVGWMAEESCTVAVVSLLADFDTGILQLAIASTIPQYDCEFLLCEVKLK